MAVRRSVSADCARLVSYTILVALLECEVFGFVRDVAANTDICIPVHRFQLILCCHRSRGVLLDPLYQVVAGDCKVHEIAAGDRRLETGMLGVQLGEHIGRCLQAAVRDIRVA